MNYNLFHNTSCLGDAYSFQASFKWLKHPLRIPLQLNLSNILMIKRQSLRSVFTVLKFINLHIIYFRCSFQNEVFLLRKQGKHQWNFEESLLPKARHKTCDDAIPLYLTTFKTIMQQKYCRKKIETFAKMLNFWHFSIFAIFLIAEIHKIDLEALFFRILKIHKVAL